jgi:hypothetical protein
MNKRIPKTVLKAATLIAKCADGDPCMLIEWAEPPSTITVKCGADGILLFEESVTTEDAFMRVLRDRIGCKLTDELEAELIERTGHFRCERHRIHEMTTPDY